MSSTKQAKFFPLLIFVLRESCYEYQEEKKGQNVAAFVIYYVVAGFPLFFSF